jgi:hypothetical protein
MKTVTKTPRRSARCQWCKAAFPPKPLGRAPKFCSARCRQAACVKRNGTWEQRIRQAEKDTEHQSLVRRLREELRPEVRRQLTHEFIQSALIAGRNEWRGNKLLDELAQDFAAAGNPEAVSAIHEWQRRAREASVRRRASPPREILLPAPEDPT